VNLLAGSFYAQWGQCAATRFARQTRSAQPDGTITPVHSGHATGGEAPRPAAVGAGPQSDDHAVVVEGLTKSFGEISALAGLTLAIGRGQVFGLLGPNGSGKTTLIRMLVGLVCADRGSVTVLGRRMPNLDVLSGIGYMTQQPALYPDLSVSENVRFFAALQGAASRVDQTLETVGLAERRHSLVSALSGGMRTRVSLACAMVHHPELLLLDEPTVGVDPVLRARLWTHFGELARAGMTIVVASHVMDEAERCDRLGLLAAGRLLAEGSAAEIRERAGVTTLEEAFLALEAPA
jgi:ABC-2 type transport system ATP-binding protein